MNFFLIGQPNVGKSSIYNILTGSNKNIVHQEEGTTRDWHFDNIKNSESKIYDTPGIIIQDNNQENFYKFEFKNLFKKTIDIFLYVIDYNDQLNPIDKFSISKLRKYNKEIILIINKFDNYKKLSQTNNPIFGLSKIVYVSCAHRYGFENLYQFIELNKKNKIVNLDSTKYFSISVFGKPNAGKSTFVNSLLGFDRALTSPIAGTTSDNVSETFIYKNNTYKIVDTAGIGRKSNIKIKSLDYYSSKQSLSNIYFSDISIFLIDSNNGLDRQDKRILKIIFEKSKQIIILFNKIDLIENKNEFKIDSSYQIKNNLNNANNIKIFYLSAIKPFQVAKILDYIHINIYDFDYKITTSKLNSWLKEAVKENNHSLVNGKQVKFKYAVLLKTKPMTIKIFCNYSSKIQSSYKSYLINLFNKKFQITNQKTKMIFNSSDNPYV